MENVMPVIFLISEAILKIIFVCGNPTDWAKNLPTQIFFFDTLKNCRLADSELQNSRVQFFFIKKIWNISFIGDEKLRKHALFHRLSTLNKWLFFERWKIIKQKQIRFVIKLRLTKNRHYVWLRKWAIIGNYRPDFPNFLNIFF